MRIWDPSRTILSSTTFSVKWCLNIMARSRPWSLRVVRWKSKIPRRKSAPVVQLFCVCARCGYRILIDIFTFARLKPKDYRQDAATSPYDLLHAAHKPSSRRPRTVRRPCRCTRRRSRGRGRHAGDDNDEQLRQLQKCVAEVILQLHHH